MRLSQYVVTSAFFAASTFCSLDAGAQTIAPAVIPESFGESKQTAIEVCTPAGQRAYLSRLVCPDGAAARYNRVGSFGNRNEIPGNLAPEQQKEMLERLRRSTPLQPGQPDYHVVDGYEVACGDVKRLLFMDMYHCEAPPPDRVPRGFAFGNFELSPTLQSILLSLSNSSPPEYHDQIAGAIQASGLLREQLNRLAISGKLKGIKVLSKGDLPQPKVKLFGGFVDSATIFLSTDLLETLRKNRLYDVVLTDDVQPNNTVFVLAHLVHHLGTAEGLASSMKSRTRESYISARFEDEARAWIQAWNATIDDATRRNGERTLSFQQLSQLLLNIRYRGVFERAMKTERTENQARETLAFSQSGILDANKRNIDALVQALRGASMTDIE